MMFALGCVCILWLVGFLQMFVGISHWGRHDFEIIAASGLLCQTFALAATVLGGMWWFFT